MLMKCWAHTRAWFGSLPVTVGCEFSTAGVKEKDMFLFIFRKDSSANVKDKFLLLATEAAFCPSGNFGTRECRPPPR